MGKVYSMTIYQDSKRMVGTSTERTSVTVNGLGGWKELGRVSGTASTNMTVNIGTNPPRYLMYLSDTRPATGNGDANLRLGTTATPIDTGSNYASRLSSDNNTDAVNASIAYVRVDPNMWNNTTSRFSMGYITNLESREKLMITKTIDSRGSSAGTAPDRAEVSGKWTNTSSKINNVTMFNGQGNNWSTTSELVVLGYDPTDTHTDNFWEELASVDVTTGATISTGDFTAKKYMCVQFYLDASAISFDWQFNSSTDTQTSTYSGRHANNGVGATGTTDDYTQVNKSVMAENFGLNASPHFGNMFIFNNSATEKLINGNLVNQNTAGASNQPNRSEFTYKWSNTSAQINNITMLNSTSVSRFVMKVWGHD